MTLKVLALDIYRVPFLHTIQAYLGQWHMFLFSPHYPYRKANLCIPRNETARPRSHFLYLCICERFIFSQDRSACLTILVKYKLVTDT
jgi:hypothetical protein